MINIWPFSVATPLTNMSTHFSARLTSSWTHPSTSLITLVARQQLLSITRSCDLYLCLINFVGSLTPSLLTASYSTVIKVIKLLIIGLAIASKQIVWLN